MKKHGASNAFDRYADNYDAALGRGLRLTGEPKEFYAEGRARWLAGRLSSRVALDCVRLCLDFGCGTGSSAGCLREVFPGASYLGYDPSVESVRRARSGHSEGGMRFEHEACAIEGGTVDLAFTNGVFHHIPPEARADALRLVWRAVKPGGWFAFWENNRWNPAVHFVMSRVPFDRDAQMLFPHQARSLLRAAGFEVVLTDYLFVFPAALGFLRALEPRLCKLPLGGQYLVLARKPDHPAV
jgi:SAM-dependent methyltransferase